jgi:hypothetical protein
MTLRHKLITVAVAAVIPLGGGALALASATGAGAATTPLQVTLSADGNGTAVFNASGDPVLTLGSTGTYAQMAVSLPSSALAPATPPSFTTDNYAAGSPRWVIELANGSFIDGYPAQLGGTANDSFTGNQWAVGNSGTYESYADALAGANDPLGNVQVTNAYVVEDADQAAGTADTLTGVQYNGQTLPGTVSVTTPANQTSTVNAAITPLQVTASTNTSDKALTYSAVNLPTGLSIAAATGLISGTPTATGAFSATVTATDAYGDTATSAQFTWTINAATAPPPTRLTGRYVCGRTASRIVWKISNVQGGIPAIANLVSKVGSRWKFDYSRTVPANGSIRPVTTAGTGLKVYYDTNGSRPARHEVGAVHIRLSVPAHRVRCG